MSSQEKQDHSPLVLPAPRENMNMDLNESLLTPIHVSQLAEYSAAHEYDVGARTLVGLKDYVFDVTAIKKSFGPNGQFQTYPFKDISYALTKYSNLEEDAAVVGYASFSPKELEILDNWVQLFLKRFEVVGKLTGTNAA
ncbi:hypothetical protein B0H10DRAFT_1941285 [Mycena sp. CBHHK59/15]|nr:hypothetical protein B0H10DRAFT_1941285 [Mycena sp. CBHHK59/15]